MRVKCKIIFYMDLEPALNIFSKLGLKKKNMRDPTFQVFEVFKDSSQYSILLEELKKLGISYTVDEDVIYSQNELLASPILEIVANAHKGGYPQPEDDYQSASYDMETGCKYCTNGRLQKNPLRLKSSIKMGSNDISGIWWLPEFIITERLKAIIQEAKLTGCEFWPVIRHGKSQPFEDIFQLKITGELPPMDEKTNIIYEPEWIHDGVNMKSCPNGCGEKYIKGSVIYKEEELKDIPDFMLTKEWLGTNNAYWRWPYLSQKAYRVFLENKVKGVRFYLPDII